VLVSHNWPGNVRELERLMERAVALATSDVIELDDLPPTIRGEYTAALGPSLRRNETMRAWGSRYATLVFERCQRNKRQACRVLGISYHTLRAYLRYPIHEGGVAPPSRKFEPGGAGAPANAEHRDAHARLGNALMAGNAAPARR